MKHLALGRACLQMLERAPEPSNGVGFSFPGALTASKTFQQGSRSIELLSLLNADRANDRPPMRNDADESLRFEKTKRFADGWSADTGHLAQLSLHEPLAGLEHPSHDRFPEPLLDESANSRDFLD